MADKVMIRSATIMLALLCAGCARDDSDPPDGRSGFNVFTDALTGCQYIGWSPGMLHGAAISPRMDANGKQVCRKVKQ